MVVIYSFKYVSHKALDELHIHLYKSSFRCKAALKLGVLVFFFLVLLILFFFVWFINQSPKTVSGIPLFWFFFPLREKNMGKKKKKKTKQKKTTKKKKWKQKTITKNKAFRINFWFILILLLCGKGMSRTSRWFTQYLANILSYQWQLFLSHLPLIFSSLKAFNPIWWKQKTEGKGYRFWNIILNIFLSIFLRII